VGIRGGVRKERRFGFRERRLDRPHGPSVHRHSHDPVFQGQGRETEKTSLVHGHGFLLPDGPGKRFGPAEALGGDRIPRLPSTFTLIQEMVLGYAVWRYGLLDLSPARAAKNIIETVSDALIIVDREWRINSHNYALVSLSEYGERELAGKDVRELFPGAALTSRAEKSESGGGNAVGRIEGSLVSRSGKRVSVDVSVSELHEPDGARAGYVLVARDVSDKKKAEAEKEKLIDELRDALDNVKTLSGLIPICARCKKVRDDQGLWDQIESYVSKHSDALFSHGVCPNCMHELYGKEEWFKRTGL
jgi:PAS domain S-box-containing protein